MSLLVAATMNVMAVETARVELEIMSSDSKGGKLTLILNDEATAGAATGSAEINMTGRAVAIYAINGGYNYQIYKSNSLTDLFIGVKTNASTAYTFKVLSASGETLYLKDDVEGWTMPLTVGTTQSCTLPADQAALNTRFHLAPAPAVPGICHQNGRLEFTAYKDASVEIVDYDDNTDVRLNAQAITADYQTIDLTNVDATGKSGQLLVIVTKIVGADQIEEKLVIKK